MNYVSFDYKIYNRSGIEIASGSINTTGKNESEIRLMVMDNVRGAYHIETFNVSISPVK